MAGLDRDGIPTPTRHAELKNAIATWGHNTVGSLLSDDTYMGRAVVLETRMVCENGKDGAMRPRARPRAEDQQVVPSEGTVPALVDAETFAKAQVRLATNRQLSVRMNPHPELTLLRAGLAFCGYCKNTLITENRKDGMGRRYVCSPKSRHRHGCPNFSISDPVLDGFVWGKVARALRDPETVVANLRRQRDAAQDDGASFDLAAIDRELKEIDHKLAGLARDVWEAGGVRVRDRCPRRADADPEWLPGPADREPRFDPRPVGAAPGPVEVAGAVRSDGAVEANRHRPSRPRPEAGRHDPVRRPSVGAA